MRTYKTEGIVIKRRNFNEADRIITVFTKRHGKINLKATGVRKIISRRSPHVELLNYSSLTLYNGSGMPVLLEAETIEDFSEIKEDLTKIGFAYHLCELIDGLCPENQENKAVFDLFRESLLSLEKEKEIVGVIHDFEINLLTKLGFYKLCSSKEINTTFFIENLLERKLKAKQIIPRFKE